MCIRDRFYLTGTWVRPGERMLALYVHKSGEARLFANRLFALAGNVDAPLSEFDDTEDPIALLSQSVRPGTLGIDKSWPSHFTLRLMEARGDVRCVVGSAPVDDARMCKDEEEIALMRESSLKNDQAIVTAMGAIRAGAKESDVGAAYDLSLIHISLRPPKWHPFSRSYGVILPSSLTMLLPPALGFSPHPPVSVYGISAKITD